MFADKTVNSLQENSYKTIDPNSRVQRSEICALFDVRGNPASVDTGLFRLNFLNQSKIGQLAVQDKLELLKISARRILLKSDIASEKRLTQILSDVFHQQDINCVNVSDMYQRFHISGECTHELLRQMLSINLREFLPGHFAATEIFNLGGIVICRSSNVYELFVHRSFADYVCNRIIRCGAVEHSIDSNLA